jgi:hypothetical protein
MGENEKRLRSRSVEVDTENSFSISPMESKLVRGVQWGGHEGTWSPERKMSLCVRIPIPIPQEQAVKQQQHTSSPVVSRAKPTGTARICLAWQKSFLISRIKVVQYSATSSRLRTKKSAPAATSSPPSFKQPSHRHVHTSPRIASHRTVGTVQVQHLLVFDHELQASPMYL